MRLTSDVLNQISFRAHPAPFSSSSRPAKMPRKSAPLASMRGAASPRRGALGLATRFLRFSCPALDGKVGNMALDLGFGSSLKYACASTSLAVGRRDGFSESRDVRSDAPLDVKNGNLARRTEPMLMVWWHASPARREKLRWLASSLSSWRCARTIGGVYRLQCGCRV